MRSPMENHRLCQIRTRAIASKAAVWLLAVSASATRLAALSALAILLGCEPQPAVSPISSALPAVAAAPTPRVLAYPSSWPKLTVEPALPCPGDDVLVTGYGLPPGEPIAAWLGVFSTPTAAIPPHPRGEPGFVPLGATTADAEGRFALRFSAQAARPGLDSLWLTYERAGTIVPHAAALYCGRSAAITGRVVDRAGRPAPTGTRITVIALQGYHRVLASHDVPVEGGRYVVPSVPLDTELRFTVMTPGWPARGRSETVRAARGGPLTIDFGGPASSADPDAAAFFVGPDIEDPTLATTTVRGRVYDSQGQPVPDAWDVRVAIAADRIPVRGGAYVAEGVRTGERHFIALFQGDQHVPGFAAIPRVFAPEAVSGHPNVLDFGGPDPEAASRPYPGPFAPPPTPESPRPQAPSSSPW